MLLRIAEKLDGQILAGCEKPQANQSPQRGLAVSPRPYEQEHAMEEAAILISCQGCLDHFKLLLGGLERGIAAIAA